MSEGSWQDAEDSELVTADAKEVVLRGKALPLPIYNEYERHSIDLERRPRVQVFELCRYLAHIARTQVLATEQERRISVLPDMIQIMQLEAWNHPNIAENERPSRSDTFLQLAQVLATGDVATYRPSKAPNTDWRNWPDGGSL